MSTQSTDGPKIIIVMGVAGVGKTTIGRLIAERLGWVFFDADDFHPAENVAKMKRGIALSDADRQGWLDRLHTRIDEQLKSGAPAVLACSALKSSYRRKLMNGFEGVVIVYLRAPRKLVENRLSARTGHFFNAELLASQFEALEEPDEAIIVDAAATAEVMVTQIVEAVQERGGIRKIARAKSEKGDESRRTR